LLGTTKSGRVKLDEDGKGLRTRANVVKTELSERIKALVDSGDIGGMSIGMVVGRGNSRVELRGSRPHRSITNFKRLLDVCTTFDPAYPTTEAQFRSAAIQFANASPDLLQQVLMGAYPQLQHGATDTGVVGDDDDRTPDAVSDDGDESGAKTEHRSIAARKRALSFLTMTTGGVDDDAS
jgi:Caudovirus prohead serine protease